MIKEAIILAGGLGTRLREVVQEVPKCLAPVAGKPFLHFVIRALQQQGIESFILGVGYKHDMIAEYIERAYSHLAVQYSIEEELLGTGGAIRACCLLSEAEHIIAVNGDTLFEADLKSLAALHTAKNALTSLALKPMKDFSRYGVVRINEAQQITAFEEKQFYAEGLINGGVYAINRNQFLAATVAGKFSFETHFLECEVATGGLYGLVQDGYFIDIGIPEDFAKANIDLQSSI